MSTTLKHWAASLLLLVGGLSGAANATLLDRGPDLVYDDVLNITWTRNANLPGSSLLNFEQAKVWAANLVYAGYDDWRLPYASVVGVGPNDNVVNCNGATELACRDNEMGYMFYQNLGGVFNVINGGRTGSQTAVGGELLTGIQRLYFSGTESGGGSAWNFIFSTGSQHDDELALQSAWAVRSGDVRVTVPEPASLALLGLGLVGLCFFRRKKA